MRARKELIERKLRLVVKAAKRSRGLSLPFEDLIQKGNMGLIKIVDRFGADRGFRCGLRGAFLEGGHITAQVQLPEVTRPSRRESCRRWCVQKAPRARAGGGILGSSVTVGVPPMALVSMVAGGLERWLR